MSATNGKENKQPSNVLDRNDTNDDDDDKCGFSSGWQTGTIYMMSLDCIFRKGRVINGGRHQWGFVCAVLENARCAECILENVIKEILKMQYNEQIL